MRRTLAVLTFTALAFTATACGGDDDEGSNTNSEITKADFIVSANAICVAGDERAEGFTEPTTEDEAVDLIVNEVLPNISDQIAQIRDIGFPEGDEDELGAILDDADAVIADINADPEAFLTDENPFGEINDALNEYGVTECADAS
ncbi:MAG: hypothetical protein WB767_07055 [Nocardioides sp.]